MSMLYTDIEAQSKSFWEEKAKKPIKPSLVVKMSWKYIQM